MLDRLARLLQVSMPVAALVLVLVALQLGLQVYALVDLVRRPAVRGGNKRVWGLIIALANLPGAIAYLVAGRVPPEAQVSGSSGASTAGEDVARRTVDALYGPRDQR